MIGQDLGHYTITAKLGEGGMGTVYRAEDSTLGREVAIKVLPDAVSGSRERLERFSREARAVAALNHPNIVTIHSVEEENDVHFLTMELVEGQPLSTLIPEGGLPIEDLLDVAVQLADALSGAHEKGIVHRDLKPGNVMVTGEGRGKVLDFGLAKLVEPQPGNDLSKLATESVLTGHGTIVGTVPYMSPEQIESRTVDHRTDIFSLGIILYEIATGSRPFQGETSPAIISAILKRSPSPVTERRAELPRRLGKLIDRCLKKNPEHRPGSADEVGATLRALRHDVAHGPRFFRRISVLLGATALVVVLLGAGWVLIQRNRALALQADALPRLAKLALEKKYSEAFVLAREVERVAGTGAVADEMWDKISRTVSVASEPPEASITVQPFGTDLEPEVLGMTPLPDIRVPRGPMHWRVEREGYVEAELVSIYGPTEPFVLLPESDRDLDMVRVPGAEVELWALGCVRPEHSVQIGPFLIDRHEVSNRDYSAFVNAGGYAREEFWKHPFRDGDKALSFAEAMARFRDLTGRLGPAGWRLGSFPDGEGNLPVSGVSWYEAAAYAAFAGKSLPTIYHWYFADSAGDLQLLPGLYLPDSNYASAGPRAAGDGCVMGSHGAHDMAGNVREWSASAALSDRLALGGAWTEPSYIYMFPDQRSPFDRAKENGFRCIRNLDERDPSTAALRPLEPTVTRDYSVESPVGDEMYATFVRFFDKAPVPLEPRIESTDESAEHWIKQKVSYAAGYGGERMLAWLYVPRNAVPPYQTVIQMGGVSTFYRRTSEIEASIFGWAYAEYLLRGGRAVLLPLWKGSYERSDGFDPLHASAAGFREHVIQWVSELRYSVDYLHTRQDVDPERVGYQGISYGTVWAPLFLALEPGLRTGLLIAGGFPVMQFSSEGYPPEVDPMHFAPRVPVPVLMLNGRHDPIFPYETSQLPMYRAFGTAEADKRHATFPSGHSSSGWWNELIRESHDWLDRYFGPPNRGN
jgi:formylglycine-generating enzyme required for sulfatase activity/cephalosporin-C deacetylase-like acetyl esterase